MRVRCAWCDKLLGEKGPPAPGETSHTICRHCLRRNLALLRETRARGSRPGDPEAGPREGGRDSEGGSP